MSALDLKLPDLPRQWPRVVVEAIREAVEKRFQQELPKGKLIEVAAAERPGYTEVMVFVANLVDEPQELKQRLKELAIEVADQLSDRGYPASVLINTYMPRVRRLEP
jgi:hypothetical protein